MEELKPTEFDKSFMDFFLWGESIDRINEDGTITHIPFGSEEYEKLWKQATMVEETYTSIEDAIAKYKEYLTEEEINKLREYGK